MTDQRIAPGLLLAMPQLGDPNFSRAVVLMIEHDEHGSFGLIVNRPTELPIEEVFDAFDCAWHGDSDTVVWQGGPVMPQSGWLLHEPSSSVPKEGSFEVVGGVVLSTAEEQLRSIGKTPPTAMRFVMGYSGWSEGQLESELVQGAWLVAEATASLIFHTEPATLWETAIRSLGIEPATLFPGSGVH